MNFNFDATNSLYVGATLQTLLIDILVESVANALRMSPPLFSH